MIVPDGAADEPIEALGGKTALEAADLPATDSLASEGTVGTVETVPEGVEPGSDVAIMSLIGYDPRRYYTGRAPLELASLGVELADDQTGWRCNLITVRGEILEDFSAGHISSEEGRALIELLEREVAADGTRFYPGVGYRNLMVTNAVADAVAPTEPPHNIMGARWREHLPQGEGADFLVDIMMRSRDVLADAQANRSREKAGKRAANMVWLWGGGRRAKLPAFAERYGLSGAVITAVDLLAGLGTLIGWERIKVPGATAYFDTNYAGKAQAAIRTLEKHDFALVHIEAPDEAGHEGSAKEKVKALERIDHLIVAPITELAGHRGDMRLLVVCDHPTPVRLRTHVRGKVPFVLWGPGIQPSGATAYSEEQAASTGVQPVDGQALMRLFFQE